MRERAYQEVKSLAVYLLILVVVIVLIDDKVSGIRQDINTTTRTECQANASGVILAKYDDLVQALIDQQTTAEKLNLRKRDGAKAAADAAFAARYRADLIALSKPDCSKPLLP